MIEGFHLWWDDYASKYKGRGLMWQIGVFRPDQRIGAIRVAVGVALL